MIRVIVADDHAIVRHGICALLNGEADIQVVAEAENGLQALALCREHGPDLIVLDYDMPELDGLETTRRILDLDGRIRVLILTMYDNEEYARRFMAAGAAGYIPKKSTYNELPFAVRKIVGGSTYFTATFQASNAAPAGQSQDNLSEREFQVFIKLANGYSLKETADELNIAYSTIRTYKSRILDKLNAKNVSDLTRYAIRKGFVNSL